jgi:hypothetical protein
LISWPTLRDFRDDLPCALAKLVAVQQPSSYCKRISDTRETIVETNAFWCECKALLERVTHCAKSRPTVGSIAGAAVAVREREAYASTTGVD